MITVQGRILPKTEPYCRASFLIEISLAQEYPFKSPKVMFLDPVYHPNVDKEGRPSCCGMGHILCTEGWKPSTPLVTVVEAIIRNIDDVHQRDDRVNTECAKEYENNREKFYQNALRCTLSYGRPRQ